MIPRRRLDLSLEILRCVRSYRSMTLPSNCQEPGPIVPGRLPLAPSEFDLCSGEPAGWDPMHLIAERSNHSGAPEPRLGRRFRLWDHGIPRWNCPGHAYTFARWSRNPSYLLG